jgi:hypothetical protein
MRIAGRAFVVSAGRVLAPRGQPRRLGGRRAVVPLPGAAVLGGRPGAPKELEALDAAFSPLAEDDVEVLAGDVEFLSLADIDVTDGVPDTIIVIATEAGPQPCLVAMRPCFTILGIVGCLDAGLPGIPSVHTPN